ncbi:MAG TPA: carboxypeptidase-like regulatory domain-containing protein [Thermoanaerobaculia bacterium]|nr:carboxypeptidase-like regulatory domain-containing protein [Thermoanaerobaculia bacterium]
MRVFRIAVLSVAAAGLVAGCASQPSGPAGSVVGIAVDSSGHSLPGVTVTIQSLEGKNVDTVLTGPDGSFSFPAVPAGSYRVLTLFQGFTARPPLSATVAAGQNVQLKPLVLVPPDFPADGSGGSTPAISFVTPTPSAR